MSCRKGFSICSSACQVTSRPGWLKECLPSIWEKDGRDCTFLKGPEHWLYTELESTSPATRISKEISNFLDIGQDKEGYPYLQTWIPKPMAFACS